MLVQIIAIRMTLAQRALTHTRYTNIIYTYTNTKYNVYAIDLQV